MTALWGVGTYVDGKGRRAPWRISHDEIGRDIGVATSALGELDVAGKHVLWCSMLSEAGQFWPYVCGTVLAGARLSAADATRGDAARVAMFLRAMPYCAVFGVTSEVLDGLDDLGVEYCDIFAGVRVVAARPGAYERLISVGLAPTRFALCGPATAIGREPGGPAYVPEAEWQVDMEAGAVVVTARRPRAQAFARTPVGVRATIVDGGLTW